MKPRIDIPTDIQSMTTFRRRSGEFIKQLKRSKRPVIYRVIYPVVEKRKQVDVLHIRHGARRKVKARDLT